MFDTDEYGFEDKNVINGNDEAGADKALQSSSKERVFDFSNSNNDKDDSLSNTTGTYSYSRVNAQQDDNACSHVSTQQDDNAYSRVSTQPVYEEVKSVPEYINAKPKSNGKFLKGVKFVGMAAAFGLIAGTVFYGVNYAANKTIGSTTTVPTDVVGESAAVTLNKADNTSSSASYAVMDMSKIVSNATASVVQIQGTVTQTYSVNPFFGGGYTTESAVSGTGVIIGQNDTELLLVTNAHVVDDTNSLTVVFPDKSEASATVKGSKSSKDIAVIAVKLSDITSDTLSQISIIEIGDSDNLQMGQPVVAVGNALGEGVSSTVGWISALNRTITISGKEYENLIMTDAAINPGNSGGALLNTDGQLIGITSAKNADDDVEGMGYAIPISSVSDIIDSLMNKVVREKVDDDKIGYLGISGMDISSTISQSYGWPEGCLITKVGDGSPAEKAGFLKNDIIVSFDGEEVESFDQLKELMSYYEAGETVKIEYYRINNGEYTLESTQIVLGSRNAN